MAADSSRAEPPSYTLKRQGILLAPDEHLRHEAGGVLNPTIYEAGGKIYLMYRAVDSLPHNFSRLALAELTWEGERLVAKRLNRLALEPAAAYELLAPRGSQADAPGGGCEDPRVTAIDGLLYLCYTAYGGQQEARVALARSRDGLVWERLGPIRYALHIHETAQGPLAIDLNQVNNKDAMLFPERIAGRYALLHRPMFYGSHEQRLQLRQSIWLSFSDDLIHWDGHRVVAEPVEKWENLKLGGGTQPLRTPGGWLIFYHGVQGESDADPNRRYSAGAMLLDLEEPWRVTYRSPRPVLAPDVAEERIGVVDNVVFPTGVIAGPDGRLHVAYGMADWCIGLARTV